MKIGASNIARLGGALALSLAISAAAFAKPLTLTDLNVVLIVIDTLGARHIGNSVKGDSHTPNLDALATRGVLFERAYSPAPWTKPAVTSIFTSLMPARHGVRGLNSIMRSELVSMAELFKVEGFSTAGFISHTFIGPDAGYAQGFDRYEIVPFKGNVHDVVTSQDVTRFGTDWIAGRSAGGNSKFFLFLHYFDPHYDYQHHPQFDKTSWYKGSLKPGMGIRLLRKMIPSLTADDIKYLVGLYHEEISYTDYCIGKLIEFLRKDNLLEKTAIVVTADHGEEFMEHGWLGHTRTLYEELIHVPLIISVPGAKQGLRVSDPVSTLDILPTIFSLPSTQADTNSWDGHSLLHFIDGSGQKPAIRTLLSEVDFKSSAIRAYKIGALSGDRKLILDKPLREWEYFDLKKAPIEKHSLKEVSETMRESLARSVLELEQTQKALKVDTPSREPTRSAAEIEQLKSLGYM